VGSTLFKTINFGLYGSVLRMVRKKDKEATYTDMMIAGTVSAALAVTVLTPADRVKILLQVQRSDEERKRGIGQEKSGEHQYFCRLVW